MTRISSLPAWLLVACICGPCLTPAVADETGRQSGLTTLWQSQVMIDGTRDKIVEIHLHVHDDRADSYFELRYPGFRRTISFDDLNPRGVPFRDIYPDKPAQGAREWAELQKEILEQEGKQDVTIELITVPRTTLYALTGSGGIHAIDAETGRTRWKTRIGYGDEPTIGIASNNTRIIAVRGSRVYCLDALNGEEIWSRYAHYAPGGGVAMSDYFAYVTSINGRLQMFPLNETGLPESFFASSGPATFDPAVTPRTVSWATERGYFNVARSNIASLRYRLETSDQFQSPGAAVGDLLIANSTHGNVYALAEEYGSLVWEFAVGERLDKKPIGLGKNAVMLITASNNLLALDAKTGSILDGWPKRVSGIADYVGASQNVLYFIDTKGNLTGLNRESGSTVSAMPIGANSISIPNTVTDRLYLAQPDGRLSCLRELANLNPFVHGDDFVVGNSAEEAEAPPDTDKPRENPFAPPGDDMKSTDPDDPFGGVTTDPDDPFAEGATDKSGDKSGDKTDDKSDDDDDPFGDG